VWREVRKGKHGGKKESVERDFCKREAWALSAKLFIEIQGLIQLTRHTSAEILTYVFRCSKCLAELGPLKEK